ncbi:hypothetical protein BD410DRAFT_243784 [Rickenella mellea]|uniref:C2H2-type domain-containing protein n=1 Tax=Rickenella mellea TaxID=50990 RepID=A0A4Y7QPA8_9AGAM|nr:hypothetical protein BD410DRAFT_243784 [Rickenella mellea]
MSQQHYIPFDTPQPDLLKHPQLDFFSFHSPSDVLAPHPDLFESELDSSLAAFDQLQLQLLTVDQTDAYSFLRSDTPTCGPPSTITVSSESASAYESLSSHSESYYNYTPTNYSYPLDLDMDFQRVHLNPSDYSTGPKSADHSPSTNSDHLDDHDVNSFGTLPPASPARHSGSVYSDYGSDYYPSVPSHPSLGYAITRTVAPASMSAQAQQQPQVPSSGIPSYVTSTQTGGDVGQNDDPRKKYQCAQCPRAFARAYNLKTHMATHDPNRPKPHICPHRACSRSFSRKHDLGRHLVSIHRDETPAIPKVGVAGKDGRRWCEDCGKSYMKDKKGCDCADVK